METTTLLQLRHLLLDSRVLTVAVVVDGDPLAGLLPFLAEPDLQSVVVHTSSLARHSRGLATGAPYSLAIHEPDRPEHDPMALPRFIASGHVAAVGDEARPELEKRWLERFASARSTLPLGDFEFRRLRLESARLILGFAQAHGIGSEALAAAAALRP